MATSKSENRSVGEWVLIILICAFSIYMFVLGVKTRMQGWDMYEKSISGTLKVKAMLPCIDCVKSANSQALNYFMLGIGGFIVMILLPKIQSVSIAGASIVLKELEKKVEQVTQQGNALQDKILNSNPITKDNIPPKPAEAQGQVLNGNPSNAATVITKNIWEDDPQKGKWGGFPQRNGKTLSAQVIQTSDPDFFRVLIQVTGDKDNPLTGLVRFHLHPTFTDPSPLITAVNNIAELRLKKVWGAFTLGAELDEGNTKLELDLAELPDAPKLFRSR